MKYYFQLFFLFGCLLMVYGQEGNYILELNGQEIQLDLNEATKVNVEGKEFEIKLSQPEILLFKTPKIEFYHPNEYRITKTEAEAGIIQYATLNASGDGLMIQYYKDMSPKGLEGFMMAEITKESLNYGYEMTTEQYRSKLKSGQDISCIHAELVYNDDITQYTVCSYGGKDEGLILATMESNYGQGEIKKLFKSFWDSIKFNDRLPPPIKM